MCHTEDANYVCMYVCVYVVCPLTVQLVYVFSLTCELNYILTEVTCFSVLVLVNPFEFL